MKLNRPTFLLIFAFVFSLLPLQGVGQHFEIGEGIPARKPDNGSATESSHPKFDGDEVFQSPGDIERFLMQFAERGGRIVGGEDVDILDYPWQASVQLQPQFGGAHFCGATILSDEWVLSAAHCFFFDDTDLQPFHVRIRAGFTSLSSNEGSFHNVSELIVYPDYDDNGFQYDIALVRLANPIDLDQPETQSVPIVTSGDAADGLTDYGVMGKVSGWGALYSGGPSPDILQAVEVPIVNPSNTNYPPGHVTADMLVAGASGQDACQGDSGGPFVVPDGHGGYKVAGVVSHGVGCGQAGYPGVYARVSFFDTWISDYVIIDDPNQFTTLVYEDFGDGDIPSGWQNVVIEGPSGFPGWEWTDTGGDYGGQLNSTTAHNGYMILDSDAHGSTGNPEEADLITPSFDLSDATGEIYFYVEHLARTFGNADVGIYVSKDDFATSEEIYRWKDAPQNDFNGTNPVVSLINVSDVAQGESNVKFKFKWIGEYDYWWLVDDFKVLEENPTREVEFVVTDGEVPLENAFIYTPYTGQEGTTDENGVAFLTLYDGNYDFTVERTGFFPYEGNVDITHDGQVVNVVMDKIPAPEIEVTPDNIVIEVMQGHEIQANLNIANPGDAELEYTLYAVPTGDKKDLNIQPIERDHEPARYEGYELDKNQLELFTSPWLPDAEDRKAPSDRPDQPVEIHHDSGYSSGVGTGGAASFITAARFTADELADYYAVYELGAVKFHIRTNQFSEVQVKIWEGGSLDGPDQEIYSADVTDEVVIEDWTIHELPEMIELVPGEEYWIGYAIETTGGFPASVDPGPMVEDKGGWMYFNNNWALLPDINEDLDFNWNIRGILEPVLGVEWLSFIPASGTVDPEENVDIDVIFNAEGIEIGTHTANILVANNAEGNITIPVTMNVVAPEFDVTFMVSDTDGNPITDAVVTLDGVANAAGDYVFHEIGIGSYDYTVTHDDHLDASGGVMVVDQDVTVQVTMIPDDADTSILTVDIEDEFNEPVENAYFELDGFGSFFSDDQGEIVITVVDGDYDYTVSKHGMVSLTDEVTIAGDHTLSIVLVYLRYDVALFAEPAEGGSVSGSGDYYHGEMATVEATAAAFFDFSHWSENGIEVSAESEFTFEVVSDRNLVAHFDIHTYTINATASPEEGGIVAGTGEYDHGSEVTLTAVPADVYHFVEWTENGETIGDEAILTFDALDDRDLVAHFEISTYNLTFDVRQENMQPIFDAIIEFEGIVYEEGHYVFEDLEPGSYDYVVMKDGYFDEEGEATIVAGNLTHQVILSVDDTSIEEAQALGINVYPNPVSTVLNVVSEQSIEEIRILDVSGREVIYLAPGDFNAEISVNDLNSGMYIIQVTTPEHTTTLKFQKH